MGEIVKGNYFLHIIDGTGQFTIKGNGYVEQKALSGGDSDGVKDAKDIIDLLNSYVIMRKRNHSVYK